MISTASARALGGSRCRSSDGTTMAEPSKREYNKADHTEASNSFMSLKF